MTDGIEPAHPPCCLCGDELDPRFHSEAVASGVARQGSGSAARVRFGAGSLPRRGVLAAAPLLASSPAWGAGSDHASTLPRLEGRLTQGGLLTGRVPRGTRLSLDGRAVPVATDGRFAFGFGRDAGDARLVVRMPGAAEATHVLSPERRTYVEQRINGLPQAMVTPDQAALERIRAEQARINAARAHGLAEALWGEGFVWPAEGPISGVYGSRRILNGEPRAPHLGVDVAGPVGTRVAAAGRGIVRLAEPDLYFTGGTVILDHGLGVTTLYAHLSRIVVAMGERLEAGRQLGLMGATGRVTGPHLHLGANWFGVAIDPALMLPPRQA